MMLAISWSDFEQYGCPKCGCDYAARGNFVSNGVKTGTCGECGEEFVLLPDGVTKSHVGFGTGKKDAKGNDIFEHPELSEHPRKGTPRHKYKRPDIRPEVGEYWHSRGVGYDLSGFVKSKEAGERILEMVKKVLDKKEVKSWLDYREYEPTWIQFKFQPSEFDLEKLDDMARKTGIVTEEMLYECKLNAKG